MDSHASSSNHALAICFAPEAVTKSVAQITRIRILQFLTAGIFTAASMNESLSTSDFTWPREKGIGK